MRDVVVKIYRNPFDDLDVKVTPAPCVPESVVLDYIPEGIEVGKDLRVLLDGQFVEANRLGARKVNPGSEVAIFRDVGEPVTLIMTGALVGAQALAAGMAPKLPSESPMTSGVYGSLDLREIEAAGKPVQIAYGEHLVPGVIIDRRIYSGATGKTAGSFSVHSGEFMTRLLVAFGEGPWEEIGGHTTPTGKLYLPENAPTGATLYDSPRLLVNSNPAKDFAGRGYVAFRLGRINQGSLPGEAGAGIQKSINTQMRLHGEHGTVSGWKYTHTTQPHTYTTSGPVHSLGIMLSYPKGLHSIDSRGTVISATQGFRIRARPTGSTEWVFSEFGTADGKFTHPDVIEIRMDFERAKNMTPLFGATVDIEVVLYVFIWAHWITGRVTSGAKIDPIYLHSVIEINRDIAAQYPNTVLAEIVMSGEGMSGAIDTVSAHGQCCKVWLESDLDHEPTFTWTKNPAHILKDYICSLKGGGNEFALENVHRQDFASLANYCDEWVSDGQGGTMRRWECNYIVDGQKGFRDHIAAICATARASHYWDGKQIRIAIDREADPVGTFSMFGHGNIKSDTFKSTEIPLDNRPNAVEVLFLNKDEGYVRNTATWKNHDRIRAEGLRLERVTLYGITKWARAIAAAHYLVNVATYRTKLIEFEAFVEGTACRPGNVIAVHHEAEGFNGISGRLVLDTPGGGLGVYLDQPLTISDETAPPKIGVVTSGSPTGERVFQVRTVVSGAGVYARGALLQVSPSFDADDLPKKLNNFVCGWDAGYGIGPAKPYTVIGIKQASDLSVQITAVTYDERVYQDGPAGAFPTPKEPAVTRSTIPGVPRSLMAETLPGETLKTTTRSKLIRVSWKNRQWPWPILSWVYVRCVTMNHSWGLRFKAYGEWYDFDDPLDGYTYEIAISPISADGAFFRAPQRCPTIKVTTARRAGVLPPRLP